MAKSKKTEETTETAAEVGTYMLKQMEEAGLGPLRWLGTNWVDALADINNEITDFVAERIREDIKTQQALLHCKSPEEVQKTQLAFLEKAFAQYTAETGKLVEMSMSMFPGQTSGTKNTPV